MHRESGTNQFVSSGVVTLPHLLQGGGGIQEFTVVRSGGGIQPLGGWNQDRPARSRVLLTLVGVVEVAGGVEVSITPSIWGMKGARDSRTPTPWCRVLELHSSGAGGRVVMLFLPAPPGAGGAEVAGAEWGGKGGATGAAAGGVGDAGGAVGGGVVAGAGLLA